MRDEETKLYRALSAAGKKNYSRDRADECDRTGGEYGDTFARLKAGYYK